MARVLRWKEKLVLAFVWLRVRISRWPVRRVRWPTLRPQLPGQAVLSVIQTPLPAAA